MSKHTSIQRLLGAAGVLALCAAALPAVAQQAGQQVSEQAVQSTDAVTVTRDATTGKLRAATAEEQQALKAAKAKFAMRVAAPAPQQKVHASGARGARLTDEFLTSSVAVRQPDGTLKIQHGTTETADADAHAATHAHNTPVTE
jgi:hypothetical protein